MQFLLKLFGHFHFSTYLLLVTYNNKNKELNSQYHILLQIITYHRHQNTLIYIYQNLPLKITLLNHLSILYIHTIIIYNTVRENIKQLF